MLAPQRDKTADEFDLYSVEKVAQVRYTQLMCFKKLCCVCVLLVCVLLVYDCSGLCVCVSVARFSMICLLHCIVRLCVHVSLLPVDRTATSISMSARTGSWSTRCSA